MCGSQKHQVSENPSFFTMFTVRAQKATRSSRRRSLPMPRNALGRGLGALIRELEPKSSPEPAPIQPHATTASGTASAPAREAAHPGPQQIDIDLIEPSPYQPRTRFREEALDELSRSIQASRIIQPLVVRPIGSRFRMRNYECAPTRWMCGAYVLFGRVMAVCRGARAVGMCGQRLTWTRASARHWINLNGNSASNWELIRKRKFGRGSVCSSFMTT